MFADEHDRKARGSSDALLEQGRDSGDLLPQIGGRRLTVDEARRHATGYELTMS